MAIDFVYFDLGNILVRFDVEIAISNVARVVGVSEGAVRSSVYDSGLQDDYECGRMNGSSYAETVRERLGVSAGAFAAPDFLEAISDMFTPIDGMVELVRSVHRSVGRVGLLSNTCEAHWEWIRRQSWQIGSLPFESLIMSYQVGAMKPDQAIYSAAEQASGVPTERMLFLDDKPENIAAARERGWQAEQCFGGSEAQSVIGEMVP
ncbi:MAG: HAD family phosphatase [Planctomycetota bacterium]